MKNKKSITILMVAFTLASCQSYKRVPYLQSYESLTDKGYKEIVINEVNQQDSYAFLVFHHYVFFILILIFLF